MSVEKDNDPKGDLLKRVRAQVSLLIDSKQVIVPKDYSVENALQSAWFIITEMHSKKKVAKGNGFEWIKIRTLDEVTMHSVANSLFKMVVEGLNPYKSQCSFIKRDNELQYSREYQGSIALSKRYSGVKDVRAREVYKDDELLTEILSDGRMILKNHEQDLKTMSGQIIGAYCIVIESDGSENLVLMTMKDIENSWSQGYSYKKDGDGVHQKFTSEMVKKTVINRACKPYINSSSDESIIDSSDKKEAIEPQKQDEQKTLEIKLPDSGNKELAPMAIKPQESEENESEEVPY